MPPAPRTVVEKPLPERLHHKPLEVMLAVLQIGLQTDIQCIRDRMCKSSPVQGCPTLYAEAACWFDNPCVHVPGALSAGSIVLTMASGPTFVFHVISLCV